MKKALLLGIAVLFCASLAYGQAGVIGTYGDPGGINCNVVDGAPGLLPVFVVHTLTPGSTASQWRALVPACAVAALWLSDTAVFPVTIGNSQAGVAIGYGACRVSPIHILTINLFAQGLSTACCKWTVGPDPNVASGQIEVVDCQNNLLFGNGATHTINGNQTCPCAIPTEESTWGKVKSLYGGE